MPMANSLPFLLIKTICYEEKIKCTNKEKKIRETVFIDDYNGLFWHMTYKLFLVFL